VIVTLAAGIGLVLVVVGPPYALWARRRLRRTPGVFACRLQPAGLLDGARWPGTKRHAVWVHDVLLVHHGLALGRCEPLGVATATGPVKGSRVRGLGDRPVHLRLHLDDGRVFDLAVRKADEVSAVGPFVVASLRSA